MKKGKGIGLMSVMVLMLLTPLHSKEDEKPFCNKLIFSETPEIGRKWHGGIRTTDFFCWEGYFNIYNWVMVDFLRAGFGNLKVGENGKMKDYFYTLTLKSRPIHFDLFGGDYKAALGMKYFKAPFAFVADGDSIMRILDSSFMLFVTQGYGFKENHLFNLMTSLSFRDRKDSKGKEITGTTYYLVPGYQYAISEKWFFSVEYYMTNTERLPLKILQFAFDKDKLDFYNTGREMYSWLFYGCHYSGKHLRVDLNLANHYSFSGIILPMIGVGWNF